MAKRRDVDTVFAVDEAKEVNGVELQYGHLKCVIARTGGSNKEFVKAWEEAARPFRKLIDNGIEIPEDVAKDIAFLSFSTLVKSWNLTEDDDTPVPCTQENVIAEFDRNREFFNWVREEAMKLVNFRKAQLGAAAGN